MDPKTEKYLPWFILKELPLLGNRQIKRLIQLFNTPEAILNARPKALAAVNGTGPKAIKSITSHRKYIVKARESLDRIIANGLGIAALTDTDYPKLLKEISDPSPLLIYDGKLDADAACISIVGSRKATRYGLDTAEHLAGKLAARGFTVVSGMALGIDTAAHQGALNASGKTLAVLGSGLGHVYPRQNRRLYRKIRENGAVLTEFNFDTPPLPAHFPQRNRIIAGLSAGTIVVEAARRSGSLITARLAGEYNREIFAVPGSVRSSNSRGTHELIRQGAVLVENEMDVIDELHQFVHREPATEPRSPVQKKTEQVMDKVQTIVYKNLEPYPKHIDTIIEFTGIKSSTITAALLDMELSGLIVRHPGNYFSKSEE
ncbi:MAG: DNA-processing protein DprA [Desulfobacterales bacterium]|nr:DNA-processing protein DprA [Desulfobacterales bacterium]